MKIIIEKIAGKWTLNGKIYNEMDVVERQYFESFLREMRFDFDHIQQDN